jgi:hypothetical protein
MCAKYLQKMYMFLHMDSELNVWAGLYVQSKLIGILTFKKQGQYLNFSARFMKNIFLEGGKKDKTIKNNIL